MGNPDVSSTVQAACVWYGIYDLLHFDQQWQRILKPGEAPEKEDYDALGALIDNPAYPSKEDVAVFASASSHVHSQMPPMLLFHGTADRVVPYLQTVEFFEKYIQANDHAKIHMEIIENAPHGGPAFINEANMDQVKRFFLRWLKEN